MENRFCNLFLKRLTFKTDKSQNFYTIGKDDLSSVGGSLMTYKMKEILKKKRKERCQKRFEM